MPLNYTYLGRGYMCDYKSNSSYTRKDGCDGWKGLNAEECQAKCTANDVPNDSCNKGKVCKYALYAEHNPTHCHLADMMCDIKMVGQHNFLYRKGNDHFQ